MAKARAGFYAIPVIALAVVGTGASPAAADQVSPSLSSYEGEKVTPNAEQLNREKAVLERPAPAPRPIPVDELPLNDADKRALKSQAKTQNGAGAVSATAASADVFCGNWLSDPAAVSYVTGTTRSPVASKWRTDYYLSNEGGPFLASYWQVNDGQVKSNGVVYAWSKAYHGYVPDATPFASRITTGWWDNSNNPHFCGWGSSQYRSISSGNTAYTAGVRQMEASAIRAHAYVDGEGWIYGAKYAY